MEFDKFWLRQEDISELTGMDLSELDGVFRVDDFPVEEVRVKSQFGELYLYDKDDVASFLVRHEIEFNQELIEDAGILKPEDYPSTGLATIDEVMKGASCTSLSELTEKIESGKIPHPDIEEEWPLCVFWLKVGEIKKIIRDSKARENKGNPFSEEERWLRISDLAKLYQVKPEVIYYRLKKDEDARSKNDLNHEFNLPEPEIKDFGRSMVFDSNSVLRHIEKSGMEAPKEFRSLGIPKPKIPEGDELMNLQEVMAHFGYTSRTEFQNRMKKGEFPDPDFRYGRPYPSFWLRSSVVEWDKDS